jgi:2-hydroxychromene-2-carboxylate isomerase
LLDRCVSSRYPHVAHLCLQTLVRGCWEQNLDMANDEVLRECIDAAGFDGSKILEKANSAEVKADLRARTKEAVDEGVCGVPSYRIFKKKQGQEWKQVGDIVWGQDLINDVEDYIAGWEPDSASIIGTSSKL